jgi:hypothetical protein
MIPMAVNEMKSVGCIDMDPSSRATEQELIQFVGTEADHADGAYLLR